MSQQVALRTVIVSGLPPCSTSTVNAVVKFLLELFEQFLDEECTQVAVFVDKKHNCAAIGFPSINECSLCLQLTTTGNARERLELHIDDSKLTVQPYHAEAAKHLHAHNAPFAYVRGLSPETRVEDLRRACSAFLADNKDNTTVDVILYRQHTKQSKKNNSYAYVRFPTAAECQAAVDSCASRPVRLPPLDQRLVLEPVLLDQALRLSSGKLEWNVKIAKDLPHRCFIDRSQFPTPSTTRL